MKTINKIFLSAFAAVMFSFAISCTPAGYSYPPGHGCLNGSEFSYHYHDPYSWDTTTVVVKLFTELNILSMERRCDFTDYAFMFMGKAVEINEWLYGDTYETVGSEHILQYAQTFKWSVSEDGKTLVLHYVNPDELPKELKNPEEYHLKLLGTYYYTEDFDLSSKLFINEGEMVLHAVNYVNDNYLNNDFAVEIGGKEYILEKY